MPLNPSVISSTTCCLAAMRRNRCYCSRRGYHFHKRSLVSVTVSGFEWNSKKLNRVFLYASLLVKREILIRAKNTTEEEEEGEEDEEEEEREEQEGKEEEDERKEEEEVKEEEEETEEEEEEEEEKG